MDNGKSYKRIKKLIPEILSTFLQTGGHGMIYLIWQGK